MLVLSRKINQTISLSEDIEVTVLGVQGSRVRLGINAPKQVTIRRGELQPASNQQSIPLHPAAINPGNKDERKTA